MNCKIIMATAILVLVAGTFVVLSDESDAAAGIDTSEFAGDYYAQKDDGTWFKAFVMNADGTAIAYKAYPGYGDNKPEVNSTQEHLEITSIDDNGDTVKLATKQTDRNNITQSLTFHRTPGTTTDGTMGVQSGDIIGTTSKQIHSLIRAAPEGAAWFEYSTTGGPDFTPYYLTDAVEKGMGDVVITLPSGTYSLTFNSTDFRGDSLTIRADQDAEVHMTTFSINNLTGSAILNLEGLIFDGLTGTNASNEQIKIQGFKDMTIQNCTVVDRLLNPSNNSDVPGTTIIRGCTLTNEGITDDRYAITACNTNLVLEGNLIDGYARGVNLQGKGTGYGSIVATGNTIQNTVTEDEGAIQIADGLDGVGITISNNIIRDCKAAVAIHEGIDGMPEFIDVTENHITGTDVGILYKAVGDENRTDISVHADANYFAPEGDSGGPMAVYVQGEGRDDSLIQEDSYYVDSDMQTSDDEVIPPWVWDDDDEYIPPIVPVQPEDSGDDSVTVVACAAAAVVAALMAAFLILDRKR